MNKGYLRNLLQYLSSVYDIGGKIKKLKDKRSNPKITTAAIAFSVLLASSFIPSTVLAFMWGQANDTPLLLLRFPFLPEGVLPYHNIGHYQA